MSRIVKSVLPVIVGTVYQAFKQYFVALGIFLSPVLFDGCQSGSSSADLASYIGAYQGTIPCADCEGIEFRIQLGEDGRYISTSLYLGKSSDPFRAEGEYKMDKQERIVLNPGMEDQQMFLADDNGLWWLDQSGERISGNLSAHYRLSRWTSVNSPATGSASGFAQSVSSGMDQVPEGSDLYIKKWEEGIVFYALGTEPFWSLDWFEEEGWMFKTADGFELKIKELSLTDDTVNGFRVYASGDKEIGFSVELTPESCQDAMSGSPFDYRVLINITKDMAVEPVQYGGCGSYSADPRLHSNWSLLSIDGQTVRASEYPMGAPNLELNLAAHRVYGFDGCNRFMGFLAFDQGSLSFGSLAGTLMACEGDMMAYRTSSILSDKTLKYQLGEEGHLILLDNQRELLRYKFID